MLRSNQTSLLQAGGVIADTWGITAPFWFGFFGSAILVAALWRQLTHTANADEAQLAGEQPDSATGP